MILIFISTSTCTHFCKINFRVDLNKKNMYMFKDTTNAKRRRFNPIDTLRVRNSLSLHYILLKQNIFRYRNIFNQNCTKARELNPKCKPHHISTNCNMVNIHQCNLNTSQYKYITAVKQNVEVK